jgi:lysine 2,3-aminomutase
MDRFIGRKGVFLPKLIIVDENGNHIETTNRTKLPTLEKIKKAELLEYEIFKDDMPLTNPALIQQQLDESFKQSKFMQIN